jgi:serine/threonine protein phosphatase PrpC
MTAAVTPSPDAPAASLADTGITIGAAQAGQRLVLRVGCASGTPPGKINEDFHGLASSVPVDGHGVVLAVADGIGGDGAGRQAAEIAVRTILSDYPATPASWSVTRSLDRLLRAVNEWLHSQGQRHRDAEGFIATMSAIVFREGHYHLAHVGDTRVYRRRGAVLKQLTTDHVWPRHDMRHVPKRALGLDSHLVADYAEGELLFGDTFLIVSDGVWEVLGEPRLQQVLVAGCEPQTVADALVAEALAQQARYMGRNDATAVIVRIDPQSGATVPEGIS